MLVPPVIDRTDDADVTLLLRLASPHPGDALERLYDRYATPVYRLALRAMRDAQLAEDVVQDAFVRLWRSAERFDPARGAAAAWIFSLARRAAIDAHRRRPPAGPELPDDLADDDRFDALVTSVCVRVRAGGPEPGAPGGARAGLRRRPHPGRDRRAARRTGGHRQVAHPPRHARAARVARRAGPPWMSAG